MENQTLEALLAMSNQSIEMVSELLDSGQCSKEEQTKLLKKLLKISTRVSEILDREDDKFIQAQLLN